jgi:hypothetical protein
MTEKNVAVVEKGIEPKIRLKLQTLDDLIVLNAKYKHFDIREGITLLSRSRKHKFIPSARLAQPGDEKEIVQIFKEIYRGKYPFREFEKESEILKMIEDPMYYWVVFKNGSGSIIGCIGLEIEIENKRGILHGLAFKRQYQGLTDLYKLFSASFCSVLRIFEKEMLSVSCEVRSAHSKSQYMGKLSGFVPVAFLPNKDIFFDKEESEIIVIAYREAALKKYRSPKTATIPFQVLKSFSYASQKLGIGPFKVKNYPNLVYRARTLVKCRERFLKHIEQDKYDNECVTFSYGDSSSYFIFFHNTYIKNIERISYSVQSKEELFVFLEKLFEFMEENLVRYCDCFVSAYDPLHQAIFLNAGFEPYGYIPAYKYNRKEDKLEDQVVFAYYRSEVNPENLKLIPETKELVKILKPSWNLP